MCDYSGSDFGAHYPDSCCIDGFLWDLDSGGADENGNSYLDVGGDIPCPKCNKKKRVNFMADDLINDGYESLDHPLTTKMVKNALSELPANQRRMAMRYWRAGRTEAIRDAKQQG